MRQTPLHDWHVQNQAEMIEYAGWHMPVWYKTISDEHLAVRNAAGIFDISHMGRLHITGPDAANLLQKVTSNDISLLNPLAGQYSVVCNENGGIKDDVTTFKQGQEDFLLVCNAANRDKILAWVKTNAAGNVRIDDLTEQIPMFALQGPLAQRILQRVVEGDLSLVKRWKCAFTKIQGESVLVTRTGYTGEDGFEIYSMGNTASPTQRALKTWTAILNAGKNEGILPCGLGARDSLRLEAGYPLYGNEIEEDVNPFEAKLDFAVKLEKPASFNGKEPLTKVKGDGLKRVRVGIKLLERGSPRKDYPISVDGEQIGKVTSGLLSPLTGEAVGMGYVDAAHSGEGVRVEVGIRDRNVKAEIRKWPFYDEKRYGFRREIAK